MPIFATAFSLAHHPIRADVAMTHEATLARPRAPSRELLRDAACAVGVFGLLNVLGELVRGPFDVVSFFVSMPAALRAYAMPLEALVAGILVLHGFRPLRSRAARALGAGCLGTVGLLALLDTMRFYAVLLRENVSTSVPFPGSIAVLVFFVAVAADVARGACRRPWTRARAIVFLKRGAIVTAALPLLLMVTFGPTSYARHADCAVVLGAKVWDDGTPSLALADRVDEAIRLYHEGLVATLVMSGARDERNGHSEPQVMKTRAVLAGVAAEHVLLDERGTDTAATARSAAALMRRSGMRTAIAVSHYYHEPRTKMLFDRAGVAAVTVPATMTRRLAKEPYYVVREIVAFYHSWLLE